MDTYQIQIGERLVGVPWWWFDVLLGWVGLMGVILWLFGKPLIKPTAAITAMVGGAVLTGLIVDATLPSVPVMPCVVAAGVILAVLGWLMWRLWLGFGLAKIFVIAAAAVIVATSGLSFEPLPDAVARAADEVRATYGVDVTITNDATNSPETPAAPDATPDANTTATEPAPPTTGSNGPEGDAGTSGAEAPPKWEELRDRASAPLKSGFDQWWQNTTAGQVALLLSVCSAVAMLGLVLGIMFPNFSGPLVIAGVGVSFMTGGVLRLTAWLAPSLYETAIASGVYCVAGVLGVTLLGATIQWTVYRKRSTDKSEKKKEKS
ncbi:MAG: hypothetical protein GC159_01145 [Phycisphaera sp.]|nr:hypothetical protein [Phycisphaera sp.]